MITVAQFRANFPEFISSAMYPSSGIQFWLDFASGMIDSSRFAKQYNVAVELYTAHFIVLEAQAMLASAGGGIPGQTTGVVSSKSVDKVTISYDTGAGTEAGAGHWNLTIYGTRFIYLTRMFGAGGMQLGIGHVPVGVGFGKPWVGPDCTPGFTNFGN